RARSSPQPELLDESAVAVEVLALEVVEQPPPLADEHQQAAPRVVVVLVLAEVLGEVVDAAREQRDLHLGRARIRVGLAELLDDFALLLGRQRHGGGTVAEAIWRASSTSRRICATRSSTESNRFSPRIRSRK